MPRNVRNWWLEGRIDGQSATLTGGPAARDGGFSLRIYQRDRGSVTLAGTLRGFTVVDHEAGTTRLILDLEPGDHPIQSLEPGGIIRSGAVRISTVR